MYDHVNGTIHLLFMLDSTSRGKNSMQCFHDLSNLFFKFFKLYKQIKHSKDINKRVETRDSHLARIHHRFLKWEENFLQIWSDNVKTEGTDMPASLTYILNYCEDNNLWVLRFFFSNFQTTITMYKL